MSLGNVIPASYQMSVIPFLNESDTQLMQKYRVASFELQVSTIFFTKEPLKLKILGRPP